MLSGILGSGVIRPPSGTSNLNASAQYTRVNSESLSIDDPFSFHDGDWTVGVWVAFDDVTVRQKIAAQYSFTNRAWFMHLLGDVDGSIRAGVSANGTSSSSPAISAIIPSVDEWVFVLFKHEDGVGITLKVFSSSAVDTDFVAHTGGVHDSSLPLWFGRDGAGDFLDGRTARGFVTKRLTTDEEDLYLWNNQAGRFWSEIEFSTLNDDDLQAYWNMNESSGTRADSKNNNDLTDNNTVTQGAGIT